MKKIISMLLAFVMLLSLTACGPGVDRQIEIRVSGVAQGAPISGVTVAVTYGDQPLEHSISWGIAKGDEIVGMGDMTTFDIGYYQLTVTYTLPKGAENAPVVNESGELTETKDIGNGQRQAILGYYFNTPEEPQQDRLITISVSGVEVGAPIAGAVATVTYGDRTLDSEIRWGIAIGDTIEGLGDRTVFTAPGLYQATVIYTIPAEIYPTDGEGIPVLFANGEGGMTAALGDDRYSAVISFHFGEEEALCQHEWMAQPLTGTCTEGIVKHAVCALCGEVWNIPEEPTDHSPDWDNATTEAATCVAPGKRIALCLVCGETVEEQTDDPTGRHSYYSIIKGGKCDTGLTVEKTCTVCGRVTTETQTREHSWGAAVYWNNHTHQYTCTACGETKSTSHSTDSRGYCAACNTWIVN